MTEENIFDVLESRASHRGMVERLPGWEEIIKNLHHQLVFLSPDYTLQQVKEKFMGLRYYATYVGDSDLHKDMFYSLISSAESKSYYIDPDSGEPRFPVSYYYRSLSTDAMSIVRNEENKIELSFEVKDNFKKEDSVASYKIVFEDMDDIQFLRNELNKVPVLELD